MPASRDPHAGSPLRLLTLGRAELVDPAGVPLVGQRRRVALLTIVAAAGERGISRDKLIAYLSPERPTDSARHSLHQLLYYLRQQGGADIFLGSDPLRVNPAHLTYDVTLFDSAFDAGAWEAAARLYHGPFLDGFHLSDAGEFDEWSSTERTRLALRYRSALLSSARAARERGDLDAATSWCQLLTSADPLSVPATLEAMYGMAAAHDRAGALRLAQAFQHRLHDELGASPDMDVAALAETLRGAPPLGSGAAVHPEATGSNRLSPEERRSDPPPERGAQPSAGAPPVQSVWSPFTWRRVTAVTTLLGLAFVVTVRVTRPANAPLQPDARAVAILPVENFAGDSVKYVADGIETMVHDALQRVPALHVVPPAVMKQFLPAVRGDSTLARQGRAAILFRSRLVREEDSLRWIAELTTPEGVRIGGGRFIIDAARMPALAAEITDSVGIAMGLQRGRRRNTGPRDGEVQLLVMRAEHFMLNRDAESVRRAQMLLDEAIERDPLYADAYSRLSGVYGILGSYGVISAPQAFELADAAARRALALDPAQTMAMAALAHERNVRYWQWADGERELRQVLTLEPWRATTWNMLGTSLRMTGRFDEARQAVEHARSLDPLARHYTYQMGHVYRCAGQLDSALVWLQRALVISPTYVTAHEMIADVHAARGQPESALESWRTVARITRDSGMTRLLATAQGQTGLHRFLTQRSRLQLQAFATSRGDRYVSSFSLAVLSAMAGDSARALDLLERAALERDPALPAIACISAFGSLRATPRFTALMRTMHLTDASYGER